MISDLSVVVIAKNEEKTIKKVVKSLSFCAEIIVIDDFSEDSTFALAKKNGAKVYKKALDGNFSGLRNFGLSKTTKPWVLFVDADEEISPELAEEIQNVLKNETGIKGYFLKREDFFLGNLSRFGEFLNFKIIRLGRKGYGLWSGKVHEVWKIEGKKSTLINPIRHNSHKSITTFLRSLNQYTSLRARELYEKRVRASFLSILGYPTGKFLYNYVARLGFLDGTSGMLFSILMSLHSFLVRGKLWLLWHEEKLRS